MFARYWPLSLFQPTTNTKGDPSAGGSFAHSPYEQPGFVQRGIGKQNVQVIFMTPTGNIFHVATGFLPTEVLASEIKLRPNYIVSWQQSLVPNSSDAAAKQKLVSFQTDRLRDRGYSQRELAIDRPSQRGFGFGPGSLQQMVGQMSVSGGDDRQCLLRDTRYVLHNPLIHCSDFEKRPGDLVGHGKSFFGSRSGGNVTNPFGR